MITEIFDSLKQERWPDEVSLRAWFDLALIKKTGVMRQPYHCRSNDPKINPPPLHLFWAAIFLQDREAFSMVEGILLAEDEDAAFAGKREVRPLEEIVANGFAQLLDRVGSEALRHRLQTVLESFREP